MLGKAQAYSDAPYQAYGGQRIAEFSPMQNMAFGRTANQQVAGQLAPASQLAGMAGLGSLNTNYMGNAFSNQYQAPQNYQESVFNPQSVSASNLQNYQMGPAERVRTQSFTSPGAMGSYMSPYQQNVTDIQKREASRQSAIMQQQQQGQAAQQGAFGGARSGIVEAERQRNLGMQLNDIQAQGSQAAYQNAQQQFNAEQQARTQAAMANQAAGLTTGQQNLSALLGVQQFGAGQNLQSQLANQQYGFQAQQAAEQAKQFGYGQNMTAAQLAAQYGQSAQQAGEQSKQFGSTLGLQGLNQAGQMASTLGQLGQAQFGQEQGITAGQQAAGTQQQGLQQQQLTQMYQDFLNQTGDPAKKLAFMSDMLRGLPMSNETRSTYTAPASPLAMLGTGIAAYSATKKNGGIINMANGGLVGLGLSNMAKKG